MDSGRAGTYTESRDADDGGPSSSYASVLVGAGFNTIWCLRETDERADGKHRVLPRADKRREKEIGLSQGKNRRVMTLLHVRGLKDKKVSIRWFGGNRSIVRSS